MTKEKTLIAPSEQLTAPTIMNIIHLSKSFGDNHVLQDFNLSLKKGENIVVLGKSGSGKSVLIKCIIGLLDPDEGKIKVYGKNIPDLNHEELDKIRAKIGFLFQSNALYDSMISEEELYLCCISTISSMISFAVIGSRPVVGSS